MFFIAQSCFNIAFKDKKICHFVIRIKQKSSSTKKYVVQQNIEREGEKDSFISLDYLTSNFKMFAEQCTSLDVKHYELCKVS